MPSQLTSRVPVPLKPNSAGIRMANLWRWPMVIALALVVITFVFSFGCSGNGENPSKEVLEHSAPKNPVPLLGWETVATPGPTPGNRSRHGLAYDQSTKSTILFGGVVWDDEHSHLCDDTWEFDGKTWKQIKGDSSPSSRFRSGMVYLDSLKSTVLFGGADADDKVLGDTWIYANHNWNSLPIAGNSKPSARGGHCLCADESAGVAVMFGGFDEQNNTLGDTWVFENNVWKNIEGPGPSPRRYASFAYHPGMQGCFLHGGTYDDNGDQMYGDSWLFKDQKWTRLAAKFDTSARDDHGLIFHRAANKMIMLEGVSAERGLLTLNEDGWELVSPNPIHPRHQATPIVWHEGLNGVLMYGGEAYHAGPQFESTTILHMPKSK
ncbi:MAG: hypothetical protein ACI87E_005035 [Mariniblastus sp.]|jgi:hypothetical protein